MSGPSLRSLDLIKLPILLPIEKGPEGSYLELLSNQMELTVFSYKNTVSILDPPKKIQIITKPSCI